MLAAPELAPVRVLLLVAIAVVSVVLAGRVSRRVGWRPAGPLLLIALTPLVPSLPVWLGLSTDDVLPFVGAALGATVVPWNRDGVRSWPRLLVLGVGLMSIAGVIAAIFNATNLVSLLQLLLKGTGHLLFLAAIAVVVARVEPDGRRRQWLTLALAAVATFEAAFGLFAWLVPLPGDAGLEATRHFTSLVGRVPGRVAGTIGLSPNFLGALFVLSIPLTVALALRELGNPDRRIRFGWWVAVGVQLLALALTFTRTSLVIAIAILAVQLLSRGRGRILVALGVLVVAVSIVTPLGGRLLGDANDRAALWTSAIRMTADHPLTGVGPGRMLIVAATDPDRYVSTDFGPATNNAHNTVLLAAAETGVLGGIGALLVNLAIGAGAIAVVVRGRRSIRRDDARGAGEPADDRAPGADSDLRTAAALGVLGFLVQGMTNNLFAVQVTSVVATLVLAGIVAPLPGLVEALRGARAPLVPQSAARRSPSGP